MSTHVLDTARGEPAGGIHVVLERASGDGRWILAGQGVTDANGRVPKLAAVEALQPGTYRLTFYTGDYFEGRPHFHPEVAVQFLVDDASAHYHVPLLLSPYGYTTYRGS